LQLADLAFKHVKFYITQHENTVCIWIKLDTLIHPTLYKVLGDNIDAFFS